MSLAPSGEQDPPPEAESLRTPETDGDSGPLPGDLVGQSVAMREVFTLLKRIAPNDSTVLLIGETGTGKGAAAKALHSLSPRAEGPFIVVDCASIASSLIESELFGHEKGSFTGAVNERVGCLEQAHGGTLFLDEIDDLALDLQPKLLRALEDRQFRRVGGEKAIPFDTRIIAASKKDLWALSKSGGFREDLFFRLSVFTLNLPPLRERKEDLPVLVDAFSQTGVWANWPQSVKEKFTAHGWPGNVRELRNAVERAIHFEDNLELGNRSVLPTEAPLPSNGLSGEALSVQFSGPFKDCKDDLIRRFEREYLTRLLASTQGNVARAAREADIDRKHLYSLLHKYDLVKE
jgi:DNA-binding NtrC family response regulator